MDPFRTNYRGKLHPSYTDGLSPVGDFITRCTCATAYSDQSNLLCFFRILITPKKVVLQEYFEWNVSYFGHHLYRND